MSVRCGCVPWLASSNDPAWLSLSRRLTEMSGTPGIECRPARSTRRSACRMTCVRASHCRVDSSTSRDPTPDRQERNTRERAREAESRHQQRASEYARGSHRTADRLVVQESERAEVAGVGRGGARGARVRSKRDRPRSETPGSEHQPWRSATNHKRPNQILEFSDYRMSLFDLLPCPACLRYVVS